MRVSGVESREINIDDCRQVIPYRQRQGRYLVAHPDTCDVEWLSLTGLISNLAQEIERSQLVGPEEACRKSVAQ